MKRLTDIIFSGVALILFALPCLAIALLLRFRNRHPILFRQERIGIRGRPFVILKFQTLVNGVPTAIGAVLRKSGLDELPQFINVLHGDMSIVGPRALTQHDINRLSWNDNYHACRWQLKPGITGLAQLYGGQHRKTSWFWDCQYISRQSVILDTAIIGLSFLMNVFGKTRVRRRVFKKKHLK
ncbi:sugar transferase [Flavobacterium sp. RHBU_24]|uniref:sugar transferase n=1 Tax=Flavobacterium sp. RHBU_24 TaxID=3391185 RepID=UPI003984B9D0